jgi:hypothetical protein
VDTLTEDRRSSLKGQLVLVESLIRDLTKKKLAIEKDLRRPKVYVEYEPLKERVISYLTDAGFKINERRANKWKHFLPKGIESNSRKHEYVCFYAAVAVWLSPIYSNPEIGKILSKDHSTISHYHKVFLNEIQVKETTGTESPIEQYLIKFNLHVKTRHKATPIN